MRNAGLSRSSLSSIHWPGRQGGSQIPTARRFCVDFKLDFRRFLSRVHNRGRKDNSCFGLGVRNPGGVTGQEWCLAELSC